MGQSNSTGYSPGGGIQGGKSLLPLTFHTTHSDNIELSADRRRARRRETFCKGICFSFRPVVVGERVFLRFAEVSSSWSGVLRFGFTNHDPAGIQRETLPRYACPDLTNKPGFWAKALPERFAKQANVLEFYVTRNGDVAFGVNGEEKGIFFGGVNTAQPLWALVDIYGNTTAMEFIDGRQISSSNSLTSQSTSALMSTGSHDQRHTLPSNHDSSPHPHTSSLPIKYHTHLSPLQFHERTGQNVSLSSDRTIVVRRIDEYCNGYVFVERPMRLGEKIVVQILSIDHAYTGGLAFGMTACDPSLLGSAGNGDLPDDSDLLLDRAEYWVVNKDVCSNPEVGDELSFHLTEDGEIRYGRNGHHVATLMHVDKTLPMWPLFDVYGNTQKIKLLGITHGTQHRSSSSSLPAGLTVSLPPPTSRPSFSSVSTPTLPPARPPPPSLSANKGEPIPALPPKQPRPGSQGSQVLSHRSPQPPSPEPLEPSRFAISSFPNPPFQPTAVVNRKQPPLPPGHRGGGDGEGRGAWTRSESTTSESMDNASNECAVCLERPADCVLYTCGHACMCYECASDVRSKPNAICPICRQTIKDIIKIYRS